MSIEQLLAKYKVQIPNNKDHSDADNTSKFSKIIYTKIL